MRATGEVGSANWSADCASLCDSVLLVVCGINNEMRCKVGALEELGISREEIIDRCVERIVSQYQGEEEGSLAFEIKQLAVAKLIEDAKPRIEAILDSALSDIVDAEFTPVDEWGHATCKRPTSLRAMVKERALAYLQDKVDDSGKITTYNGTRRAQWLALKAANECMTREVKKEIDEAVSTAKSEIKSKVAEHITALLLK